MEDLLWLLLLLFVDDVVVVEGAEGGALGSMGGAEA